MIQEQIVNLIGTITPAAEFTFEGLNIVTIDKSCLVKVLKKLKEDTSLRFTMLTDLFAADFPEQEKRFELVYNLLSFECNYRLIVKIHLNAKELAPSVHEIFSVANWYEREVFDMFGVSFKGHPDLRRILSDYEFNGHPLRKDFPLGGYVQVKYDNRLEKVVYEDVHFDQEFRDFDFCSSWKAPTYVLPGDEKASKKT